MAVAAAGKAAPKSAGLLSSLVRNIGMNIAGTAALTYDDIQPGLVQLKRKLMERNVAEEIAAKWVLGWPCASMSGLSLMRAGAPCFKQ